MISLIVGIVFIWSFLQFGLENLTQRLNVLFNQGMDVLQQNAQLILGLAEQKWLDLYRFPETFSTAMPLKLFLQILHQSWLPFVAIIIVLGFDCFLSMAKAHSSIPFGVMWLFINVSVTNLIEGEN